VTIVVPDLVVDPDANKQPPTTGPVGVDDSARHSRHVLGAGIAIGGGAAIVTSLIFGAVASSKFNTAKQDCGGDLSNCPGSQFALAQSAFNTAHTTATVSTVLFAVGAAAVAGGAVAWFTAPGAKEQQRTAWHVVPVADPHGGGLVFVGRWR
jgi:hypothetical protein